MYVISQSFIIDALTKNSVTIITIREYNGERLGKQHAEVFVNTSTSRDTLRSVVNDEIYNVIISYWGD